MGYKHVSAIHDMRIGKYVQGQAQLSRESDSCLKVHHVDTIKKLEKEEAPERVFFEILNTLIKDQVFLGLAREYTD